VTQKRTPKRGRKNRVRDWRPRFLRELAQWGNVTTACRRTRIGRTAVYQAKDSEPAFKAQWDDALDQACDAMEEEARRRAVKGTDEGVFYKGRKVAKLLRYSDTLLIFLLKAHRPEKYREQMRIEHVNWSEIVKTWSDAQIEAYRKGVPLPQVLAMGTLKRSTE
jgi:hypothetical protein